MGMNVPVSFSIKPKWTKRVRQYGVLSISSDDSIDGRGLREWTGTAERTGTVLWLWSMEVKLFKRSLPRTLVADNAAWLAHGRRLSYEEIGRLQVLQRLARMSEKGQLDR